MSKHVFMDGHQYHGTSTKFRFNEDLSTVLPDYSRNINGLFVHTLPCHLIQIDVWIGKSCIYSFHTHELASAHASGANLLDAVKIDGVLIIIPMADANLMIHELSFVYDEQAISLEEKYVMVDETLEVPVFGDERCVYTGCSSRFSADDVVYGRDLTYKTVNTGQKTRVVTKPVVLIGPTLSFQLCDTEQTSTYEIPYWQRLRCFPDDTERLKRLASNFRLTPLSHASLDLAITGGVPFEGKVANMMRVTHGMAGPCIDFA